MTTERKLDIFELLLKIDRKDYGIWETLTDDQKKEFSPLIVMRWMAGMTDPQQLIFLNELVNPLVFNLHDKELMIKLLTVCSNGKSKRYSWINYKVNGARKKRASVQLVAKHYQMSYKDAEDSMKLLTDDDIMDIAGLQGLQKDELTELKKDLKK
jgi:hypothetical protein